MAFVALGAAVLFASMQCDSGDDRRYAPTVELLQCPSDTVLYGVQCCFRWKGSDRDGEVAGYYYGLNENIPSTWTTAEACTLVGTPIGRSIFLVQAQDDGGNRSQPATCAFTVREGGCLVSPASLDFGVVNVGAYAETTFTITNMSQNVLNVTAHEPPNEFDIIYGGGPHSLNTGESLTVGLRFSPASCGAKACTVRTGSEDCSDVRCVGEGGGTVCEVLPATLSFGSVKIGASKDLSFTITNNGCSTISGTASVSCEYYAIIAGATYYLRPGHSQTVTVRFTPASCNPLQCTVDVGNGACTAVTCTGLGAAQSCEVYPKTLDFGGVPVGGHEWRSFWIKNSGCSQLRGEIVEECPAYSIDSDHHWVLAPGESTRVMVMFSPVSCDDEPTCRIYSGSALCDSVFCTAEIGTGCWVSQRSYNFGEVEADLSVNKDFDIKNLSCDTLHVDIRLRSGCSGSFQITSGWGAVVLAPGEGHKVVVRFSPGGETQYECYLELGDCGQIKLVGATAGGTDPPLPTTYQKNCK